MQPETAPKFSSHSFAFSSSSLFPIRFLYFPYAQNERRNAHQIKMEQK